MIILLYLMTLLDGKVHITHDERTIYAVQYLQRGGVMKVCVDDTRCFGITQSGERIDPILEEVGAEPMIRWDVQWYASVRKTGTGWLAEMRVPRKLVNYATTLRPGS